MRKTRVYIAGPITRGCTFHNIHEAMRIFHVLVKRGYAPMCPHWAALQDMAFPMAYEDWLTFDLEWIRACDVVLRIPGESTGADREIDFAHSIGIPVVFSVEELYNNEETTR